MLYYSMLEMSTLAQTLNILIHRNAHHTRAGAVATPRGFFGSGTGQTSAGSLNCDRSELKVEQCSQSGVGNGTCEQADVAGVICQGTTTYTSTSIHVQPCLLSHLQLPFLVPTAQVVMSVLLKEAMIWKDVWRSVSVDGGALSVEIAGMLKKLLLCAINLDSYRMVRIAADLCS